MPGFPEFLRSCLKELLTLVPSGLYLVGGFIRERLLAKETLDYDFVIAENTLEIARSLARQTGGVFILLDEERNTARIVWNKKRNGFELNFDIATIIGNSIEEDLRLRDLTINAIAIELTAKNIDKLLNPDYSFLSSELIDPTKGFNDLTDKIIRTSRKENLEADPLRLLRVFRFSAKLGFSIKPETLEQVKSLANLILLPAKERVLKELFDILASPVSYIQFEKMAEVNLLTYLYQDLSYPDKTNFSNAILKIKEYELTINNIENFLTNPAEILAYLNEVVISGHTKSALIKITILINNLKPQCLDFSHYLKKVEIFLKKNTFSSLESKLILKYLKYCQTISDSENLSFTRKALFHFFKERQNEITGALLLNYTEGKFSLKQKIKKIFAFYFEDKILSYQPQLLDGNILIKEFKLKPGQLIGHLLSELQEAQAEKKVNNYSEALEFISHKLI